MTGLLTVTGLLSNVQGIGSPGAPSTSDVSGPSDACGCARLTAAGQAGWGGDTSGDHSLWTTHDTDLAGRDILGCMDSTDIVFRALTRCGGMTDAGTLIGLTSRHAVSTAVERRVIVRDARGRYAVPTAEVGMRTANRLSAVLSHTSAAARHGWEMKDVPVRPTVTVPRNRKVPAEVRAEVDVFWRPLSRGRIRSDRATSPIHTVLDCARWLPFDGALAIADSSPPIGHPCPAGQRR